MFDSTTFEGAALHQNGQEPYPDQSPAMTAQMPISRNSEYNGPTDMNEENRQLKTRVSELEVINDLFRGRVSELENSETEALKAVEQLRARVEELERGTRPNLPQPIAEQAHVHVEAEDDSREKKRMRMSDLIDSVDQEIKEASPSVISNHSQ